MTGRLGDGRQKPQSVENLWAFLVRRQEDRETGRQGDKEMERWGDLVTGSLVYEIDLQKINTSKRRFY